MSAFCEMVVSSGNMTGSSYENTWISLLYFPFLHALLTDHQTSFNIILLVRRKTHNSNHTDKWLPNNTVQRGQKWNITQPQQQRLFTEKYSFWYQVMFCCVHLKLHVWPHTRKCNDTTSKKLGKTRGGAKNNSTPLSPRAKQQ